MIVFAIARPAGAGRLSYWRLNPDRSSKAVLWTDDPAAAWAESRAGWAETVRGELLRQGYLDVFVWPIATILPAPLGWLQNPAQACIRRTRLANPSRRR